MYVDIIYILGSLGDPLITSGKLQILHDLFHSRQRSHRHHVSYSLYSLGQGGYMGEKLKGLLRGDTRSLDYVSRRCSWLCH